MTNENKGVLLRVMDALKSAKEELWDCHSHCDPETANNGDAMAWRDCRDAIQDLQKYIDDVPHLMETSAKLGLNIIETKAMLGEHLNEGVRDDK